MLQNCFWKQKRILQKFLLNAGLILVPILVILLKSILAFRLVRIANNYLSNTNSFKLSLKKTHLYYKSIRRHLDFCERACGAQVLVSSLLLTEFTDLKTEKMAAFALIRLRNAAIILFSGFSLSIFSHFCTLKCALYLSYRRFPLVAFLYYSFWCCTFKKIYFLLDFFALALWLFSHSPNPKSTDKNFWLIQ